MGMGETRKMHDHDRACLLLYLLQFGDPRYVSENPKWRDITDEKLLSMVTGWKEPRAKAALVRAVQCGYVEKEK
jgi:hypothetical protein